MQKGKLIHCEGIVSCVEPDEPDYRYQDWREQEFRNDFLKDFELDYILDISLKRGIHFHIATHSEKTSTCQEKADLTGLPLERVIKGVYFEDAKTQKVYGLFIPGTKHSNDIRLALGRYLGINDKEIIDDNRITKARKEFLDSLGMGIEFGTVHPFVNHRSFNKPNGEGKLESILFDRSFTGQRKNEGGLDDFSFTAHPSTGYDNHRLSIQVNYNSTQEILREAFSERIKVIDLV
jgi:prolyl-tRNA editing enzyme YbaK/EbsC (Cys-tRNA(Pro) deacylase)